jgi:hypothetical protein
MKRNDRGVGCREVKLFLSRAAATGRVTMNEEAENEISRAFRAFFMSTRNSGLSGGEILSDPVSEEDRLPLATKYRRLAREARRLATLAHKVADEEKPMPLRPNDSWLRERAGLLDGFAGDLDAQALALASARAPKGRRELAAWKRFVLTLRSAYRTAGGRRKFTQKSEVQGYGGDQVRFIMELCAQIEDVIPPGSMPGPAGRQNAIGDMLKLLRRQELANRKTKKRRGKKPA